jgi:DNA polymerase IV
VSLNLSPSPFGAPESGLRWLFVDMNSFFASCEQHLDPSLRGKPVVVAPVMADSTSAIAASYEAKAFGIKTGTPIWRAKRLCASLEIVHARPKTYVEIHHQIRAAVETCIPIDAVLSIDEVACKLDRVQMEPDIATRLALKIKKAISDQVGDQLRCSIGIASTRLLAKLACDMQKPDGLVVLHPHEMPEPILTLKLQDISGIGANMFDRLQRAGIYDMHQLWAADAERLKRIWGGVNGLRFHAALHGVAVNGPKIRSRSMSHQHVLAPEQRSMDAATPVVRELCIRVAQRLRNESFFCQRLGLDIRWSDKSSHHAECRFEQTQDTQLLLNRLMELWRAAPEGKPWRVGVGLRELVPAAAHQPNLFGLEARPELTQALDRVNQRFGRGSVSFGASASPKTSKIAFHRVPKLEEM